MEKTKIVGVTFDNRQNIITKINEMVDKLVPVREPNNPHDENAINIYVHTHKGEKKSVGYINRNLAAKLAPEIDQGKKLVINDYFVTGSRAEGTILGIIISYDLTEG